MLSARQQELDAEVAAQERRLSYHAQRLTQLRSQRQQLVEQQRLVQDAIDPEATAAARLAAEQARAAEAEADRREVLNFALAFWAVFAMLCTARNFMADALSSGALVDVPLI